MMSVPDTVGAPLAAPPARGSDAGPGRHMSRPRGVAATQHRVAPADPTDQRRNRLVLSITATTVNRRGPMSSDPQSGYVIRQMRDAILDTDLKIMQLINQRLTLVRRLRTYKEEQGIPFVDPERERSMHHSLQGAHRGPLPAAGLDAI